MDRKAGHYYGTGINGKWYHRYKKNACQIILLVAFIFMFCLPQKAKAEEDLLIPQWLVDAKLNQTGDLQITEDITFEFNDKFNGVFRDIVLNRTSGVSDIKVVELVGTDSVEYTQDEAADKGDKEVFLVKEEKNKIRIQIFSPSKDQEKTFRVSYLIKNVALKYNDIGELYYKFLGNENETPIDHFAVTIELLQSNVDGPVKVFAHGPLNGTIGKINDSTYRLDVKKVPENTMIEGRLLFPKEYIPLSSNNKKIDNYSNILKEEAAYQNKREKDKERKEAIRRVLEKASFLASGFGFVVLLICIVRYRRKENIYQSTVFTGIPEDITPAIAALLTGTILNTNSIFASILDLFRKGYLKIDDICDNSYLEANKQNYTITRVKEADATLLKHERFLMNWLFNEMGDGHSVSTNDIEYFGKHNSIKFANLYNEWKHKVKADAITKGYYDNSKKKLGVWLLLLSLLLFMFSIFTLAFGSVAAVLSFAVSIILCIYSLTLFNRRSDAGYVSYRKWMDFRRYMKTYKPDISNEDIMNTLDVSFIYALGLGIVKKTDQLKFNRSSYDKEFYSNSWIFWYLLFINNDDNAFQKSMNHSFAGGADAYSGGSFSGGGGGGAGGGGAGGF